MKLSKVDSNTLNHTESGILAFLNHYGGISRTNMRSFFGIQDKYKMATWEREQIGTTFPCLCKERKEYFKRQFVL